MLGQSHRLQIRPGSRQRATKNDTPVFNMEEFEARLHKYRYIHDVPMTLVQADVLADINETVSKLGIMYNTAEYAQIYVRIKEVFEGVDIQPHTVGAMFAGCTQAGSNPCAPMCADAIKPPLSEGGVHCSHSVMVMTKGGSVKRVHEGTDNSTVAIVYMVELKKSDLTLEALKGIKNAGYTHITVSITDKYGKVDHNQPVFPQPTHIDECIKHTKPCGNGTNKGNTDLTTGGWWWILLIAVLIILLIIIFFTCFC